MYFSSGSLLVVILSYLNRAGPGERAIGMNELENVVVCARMIDGPALACAVTLRCKRCAEICAMSEGTSQLMERMKQENGLQLGVLCLPCFLILSAGAPVEIMPMAPEQHEEILDYFKRKTEGTDSEL